MDEAPALPLPVMVAFTHAAMQVLAEDAGLDVLHVKGPALDRAIVQPPEGPARRGSADADILVRPAQVRAFEARLRATGWLRIIDFADGSAFQHAATWSHPKLGYLDLHRRFPGIGLADAEAFERLWAERKSVPIAGYPCAVPTDIAQRLLLILHAARNAAEPQDVRLAWGQADEATRGQVQALAADLEAGVALAAATGSLDHYTGAADHDLWAQLSGGRTSLLTLLLARIRAAPTLRQGIWQAVRSVLPNARRMEVRLGRPPTRREWLLELGDRLGTGARDIGRAVRRRWQERR